MSGFNLKMVSIRISFDTIVSCGGQKAWVAILRGPMPNCHGLYCGLATPFWVPHLWAMFLLVSGHVGEVGGLSICMGAL